MLVRGSRLWRWRCGIGILANFRSARTVCLQLASVVQNHDSVGAGRDVCVETLLHARITGQLKTPIFRSVDRLVRPAYHVIWWTAGFTRPIAHHPHVTFDDRFFEALVLLLVDKARQFVSLDIKAWIDHDDVSGENANRFRRIEHGLVGINLGNDRFLCPRCVRCVLRFFGRILFRWRIFGWSFGGGSFFTRFTRSSRRKRPGCGTLTVGNSRDQGEGEDCTSRPKLSHSAFFPETRDLPWTTIFTFPASVPFLVSISNCILSTIITKSARLTVAGSDELSTCVFRLNTDLLMLISRSGISVSGVKVVNFTSLNSTCSS